MIGVMARKRFLLMLVMIIFMDVLETCLIIWFTALFPDSSTLSGCAAAVNS